MYETDVSIVKKEDFNDITVADLLGKKQAIEPVDRLMTVALGDIQGLTFISRMAKPAAIMWNEQEITLLSPSRTTFVIFKPELSEGVKALFEKEGKKEKGGFFMQSYNVWEGECESIQFTKKGLIDFLALYAEEVPDEIKSAIKNMKFKQTVSESESINLDDEKQSVTTEESTTTNIPRQFKVMMEISKDYHAEVEFKASVVQRKNDYGRDERGKAIELRVLNYRPVLRGMMESYLSQLPEEIPKIYGTMRLGDAPTSRY